MMDKRYARIDQADGSVELIDLEEVRRTLNGNYFNIDICMQGIDEDGQTMRTPGAYYRLATNEELTPN